MGELKVHNNVFSSSLPSPPAPHLEKGQEKGTMVDNTSVEDSKPKKKICCACPDTKKLRDECIVKHGEEACGKWIDAHRKCLRAEGFNV